MHGVDHGREGDDGFLGLQPQDFPKRLTQVREVVCMACSSGASLRGSTLRDLRLPCLALPHGPQPSQSGAARADAALNPSRARSARSLARLLAALCPPRNRCYRARAMSTKPKPEKLSSRQERFAMAIASGMSGAEASREAGYQANPNAASVGAHRRLRTPKIAKRVHELQAKHADARRRHRRRASTPSWRKSAAMRSRTASTAPPSPRSSPRTSSTA